MKEHIVIALAAVFMCTALNAQSTEGNGGEGEEVISVNTEVQVDSTLEGRDIISVLPSSVKVHQSDRISKAMAEQLDRNSRKQFTGYRIRIFFDSAKNAREKSMAVLNSFKDSHPGMTAYLTYDAPNFKVTVGNFRSRSDADVMLESLKGDYPSAFVVREKFKYPSIGNFSSRDSLTVKP